MSDQDERTKRMINDQIAVELRSLNSLFTDEEDKPAIMARIRELQAMADPSSAQPTSPKREPIEIDFTDVLARLSARFRRR